MSKRSRGRDRGMFDGLQDAPSLEDTSDAIFGSSNFPVTQNVKIKLLDISSVFPDPNQPRRALPSAIRERWNVHEQAPHDLFSVWHKHMGKDFDLSAYISDGETDRAKVDKNDKPILPDYEPQDAIQHSFIRLLELATSIYREGLANPITVSRMGRDYMIETGERRWLAYNLLHAYFGDTEEHDWSKIPARVMPERNIWRQASENNARENLNAVSRARQLAILLMDLHGWDNFMQMTDFENEQDFYAQVADGRQWRTPSDKIEQLLKVMGLSNQTQLRQYRAILRIPPQLWRDADDNDWTENHIRELMQQTPKSTSKNPKSKNNVTPVTRDSNFSPLDRAIKQSNNYRITIANKAEKSKNETRLQWQEFAREQAKWWSELAQKLDKDK